jgi:hemolysin activation/secretion protein
MDNGAQIQFRGNVQLADDQLLPLEQYAIGGVYSVRGYRENEVVRDQGYNLSIEFHYPLFSGAITKMIPGELALIPFMDYGAAWNKGDSDNIEYLHGIGVGLVWSHRRFSAELYYAHNLNNATDKFENNLQDTSLYFRVTAFLF